MRRSRPGPNPHSLLVAVIVWVRECPEVAESAGSVVEFMNDSELPISDEQWVSVNCIENSLATRPFCSTLGSRLFLPLLSGQCMGFAPILEGQQYGY